MSANPSLTDDWGPTSIGRDGLLGQALEGAVAGPLQAMFEASKECLKLIDLDGRLRAINHHGVCMLALDDAMQVLGQPWSALWPEAMRPVVEAAVAQGLDGLTHRFVGDCPIGTGQVLRWHVVVVPIRRVDGRVRALLASSTLEPGGPAQPLARPGAAQPALSVGVPVSVHETVHADVQPRDAAMPRIYGPQGGTVALYCHDDHLATRLEACLHEAGFLVLRCLNLKSLQRMLGRLDVQVVVTDLPDDDPVLGPGGALLRASATRPLSIVWVSLGGAPASGPARDGLDHTASPLSDDAELQQTIAVAAICQRTRQHFQTWLAQLSTLRSRIRHPSLLSLFDRWDGIRGRLGQLPDADQAYDLAVIQAPKAFIATVDTRGDQPSFRFDWVGSDLQQLSPVALEGQSFAGAADVQFGGLYQTYQRALCGLPSLDWVRYQLGPQRRVSLDRLVVPLTVDGLTITHLVGVVEIDSNARSH